MAIKYVTQEFDIKVAVEDVSQMQGLAIDIDYDPMIIEAIDTDPVTPNTQLDIIDHGFLPGATLLAAVATDTNGNEIPGKVVVGLNMPTAPADGAGDLFTIRFRATDVGSTTIVMSNRALYDVSGEIPANWTTDVADIIQMATITITVV